MSFDDKMKSILQAENKKVPEKFTQKVDKALCELPETPHHAKRWQSVVLSLAAVCVLLVALPNLSSTMAHAMREIPLVGQFFQAVTFRTYEAEEGSAHVYIDVPEVLPEENGSAGAEMVNEQVQQYTQQLIEQFEAEEHEEGNFDLHVTWNIVTNTENWFTLELSTDLIMAGSNREIRIYHIYVPTGEVMELSDIFNPDFDYTSVISQEIKEQMRERMAADLQDLYWLEETTDVADWRFNTISADHNFYFNEEGKLVIPFNKYEVGPGSTGTPEFVLESPSLYENLLYTP